MQNLYFYIMIIHEIFDYKEISIIRTMSDLSFFYFNRITEKSKLILSLFKGVCKNVDYIFIFVSRSNQLHLDPLTSKEMLYVNEKTLNKYNMLFYTNSLPPIFVFPHLICVHFPHLTTFYLYFFASS